MSITKLTTTNIGTDELKHLRKLSAQHDLKQVEFINACINYFRKTGINPAQDIFSPKEEIAMLTKRVDEVIKFLQVHEKKNLSPLMDRLIILEKKLSEGYANPITSSDLDDLAMLMGTYKNSIEANLTKGLISQNAQNETTLAKVNVITNNQKQIVNLIALLFEGLRNRNFAGAVKDEVVQNFQHALSQIR